MKTQKDHFLWRSLLIISIMITALAFKSPLPVSASGLMDPMATCTSPSDECWDPGFHLPGVVGSIYAMLQDTNGNIYVGGDIASAGGLPVNHVAMWDGTTWHNLDGGVIDSVHDYAGIVNALAVDDSDNLYVGGWFDYAGDVPVNNLAKWTGSAWEDVGGGTDSTITAIEMVEGGFYIGGYFGQVGSLTANRVAYRNLVTDTWSALGSGVAGGNYGPYISALEYEPDTNSLFVGGDFSTAGGVAAVSIARYLIGSSTWEAVGGGFSTLGGDVYTLLRTPKDGGGYNLYVGGAFYQVGLAGSTVEAHNIVLWNSANWLALDYGTNEEVKALALDSSGNLIVGGSFTTVGTSPGVEVGHIALWDGSGWLAMDTGLGTESYDEVDSILASGTDIIAGGVFEFVGDQVVNNLAKWNGSNWSSLTGGLGVNGTVNVMLADGDTVYAAGSITRFGSQQAMGLAKLTGSSWNVEISPSTYYIYALAKGEGNTLYAGGTFTSIGEISANYLAVWNGATWQQLAGGTGDNVLALAVDGGGNLYVGGRFTTVGGSYSASHIALWDGNWHTLGEGLNGTVRTLAVDSDGNVYAGGEFTYAGSTYVNHIAMWNGETWKALGGGLDSNYIESLIIDDDGRLYAGGYFGHAGGKLVNGVAMWNGYEWSALGSGMDDGVGTLEVDSNGYLYAGGDFDTAGGETVNHIARWDGFAWSALGSGMDSNVFTLAIPDSNHLVAGGVFQMAGGKPSSYIGVYDIPTAASAPAPSLTSLSPETTSIGGPGFWLTVNGTSFSSRSVVRWNGNTLDTTYVNGGQLKAYVPAASLITSGTASIIVYTPAPSGGGVSNSIIFEILENYITYLPLARR